MAYIYLSGDLSLFTKGENKFEILAPNIKKVFERLSDIHPELKPHLDQGIAVAIDGKVYQDAWLESLGPETEVHIFHGIGGG